MRTSRRLLRIVCASAALGVVLAGPLAADEGEGHRWPGRRRGPPPIERVLELHAERLELSAEQRAQIRRIAGESSEEREQHRERLHALHEQMRAILSQDTPDEQAVMGKADEIGAAETAAQKHRLRTMLEIRALLTPAQRHELVKIHEERRAQRREKWRERRGASE
jgi:Spy/CpxP family protein refolding chaperone